MNYARSTLFFGSLLIFSTLHINGLNLFTDQTKDILQIGVVPEKKKLLKASTEERNELAKEDQAFAIKVKSLLEEINNDLTKVKSELDANPDNDFNRRNESLLIELSEVIQELKRIREKRILQLDEYIKLLTDFLSDTDFSEYNREYKLIPDQTKYPFRELERIYGMVSAQDRRIAQISEQEKAVASDLETSNKALASLAEDLKKRRDELTALSGDNTQQAPLNDQEIANLTKIIEKIFSYKEQLEHVHIKSAMYQSSFLRFQSFIESERLRFIKTYLSVIKSRISVSEDDVTKARENAKQQKKTSSNAKGIYRLQRAEYADEIKGLSDQLENLSHTYNITLGNDIDDWSKEPIKTIDWYTGMCEIGLTKSRLLLLQQQQALIDEQINLEDERYRKSDLQVNIKDSYRRIKQLLQSDAIAAEIRQYEKMRADLTTRLSRHKDQVSAMANAITNQKKIIDSVKTFKESLSTERDSIFRLSSSTYFKCEKEIDRAQRIIQEHIEILGQLTSIHSEGVALIDGMLRSVTFIISELQVDSLWRRPEEAISWTGFKNAPSDISRFFADLRQYISNFDVIYFITRLLAPMRAPWVLFSLLLKIIALIAIIIALSYALPLLANSFIQTGMNRFGILRAMYILLGSLIQFIRIHLPGIAFFAAGLALIIFYKVQDKYIYVMFCLILIPYLLYLGQRVVAYLAAINAKYEYIFLTEEYQRRFSLVLSFLFSATTIIMLFRSAFIFADYPKSELSTILWAINYIIVQISIISLISKEQILYFVPSKGNLWRWIRDQIDQYYYLILLCFIAIIVLSHPHVGLGQLVRRALDGIIRTGILVIFLLWIHGVLKRASSQIFFATTDDVVRERFGNAKTWFGLLIIASFATLGFFGFVVSAKIWGWQITIDDVLALLKTSYFGKGVDYSFSTLDLLQIIGFGFLGLLASYAINHFVFNRIFDLLPIDSGVQHTVTSLVQYFVVIVAFYVGFNKVGLSTAINVVIVALALGLGWILKDPAADFIGYFIILVQRPIKLGDYIMVDNEVRGVVRKITARAVILRKKNSTTIVVANSYLLSKSIFNWNYTRNFIAFDDILLTVDYREDPAQVKELLQEAVESHPNVLRNPRPAIRLDIFSDYGYTFMVRGFISSVYTLEQWNIASDVRLAIIAKLREHNVQLAVPIRMLVNSESKGLTLTQRKNDQP